MYCVGQWTTTAYEMLSVSQHRVKSGDDTAPLNVAEDHSEHNWRQVKVISGHEWKNKPHDTMELQST